MKRAFLFFLSLLSLYSYGQISYVPASPYPITVKQNDGTELTILARGDEFNHYSITEDGYTVVKNLHGIYEYAEKNFIGDLIPSGTKAKNKLQRSRSEETFLTGIPKSIAPVLNPIEKILKSATSDEGIQYAFPSTGNRRALMLLIQYPDLNSTYSVGNFDNLMNQANYNGTGSFNDYFKTYSNDALNITVDVFGWYTSAQNYLYYGEDEGDERARTLVREAVDAAEAAGVDFSLYDNDNDNEIDNLIVVHAGPGAEEGSQTEYIWSHSWVLFDQAVTYDGIYINDYVIQPETRSWGMVGIGVYCHEFGHALGLPDLYDTNGGSEGLGNWCLMAGGAWLGNESTPAGFSAWCREELGWTNPVIINSPGNYSLTPAATSTQVYKLLTPNSNEYFLLENRYKTGFDNYLPGSGMAIFHINTSQSGNTNENNKLVDLEEADGDRDLDREVNRGDTGDVYPGSTNNTQFNDYTDPNARTYDSKLTGINVYDISLDGTTINFKYGKSEPTGPNLTYDPAQNNVLFNNTLVSINWRLENEGEEASGAFSVGYYLSSSSPVSTSDILMGTTSYSSLSASSYLSESFVFDIATIPSLPLGSYYVGYVIDYLEQVEETDEGDNLYTHTSEQVQLTSLANLSYDSQQNSLQIDGENITINLEVENIGTSAAASSLIGYYLSSDQNINSSDYFLGTDLVRILNAGETSSESISVDVSSVLPSLPVGNYYVGYIVDYLEEVDEENESDNEFYFSDPLYEYCPTDYTIIEESVCEGESFEFNGTNYSTEGSYQFDFTNQYGCDSVVTLNLTVHQPNTTNLNVTICEGDSYRVGNSIYTASGFYTDELTNQFGCDSTVYLNLEVASTKYTNLEVEICEGETYRVGSNNFSESGEYSTTLTSSAGCDSVVNLTLTVNPVNTTSLNETICEGESFHVGNSNFTLPGNYEVVLDNQYGCDSTVFLNLTVNPVHNITYDETICEGEGVQLGDSMYFETGIYSDILTNRFGCDSSFTLNLTVNPVDEIELHQVICQGDSVIIGNSVYKNTGVYLDQFKNQYGCDSLVTLYLEVNQPKDTIIERTICRGNNIELGGIQYSEAGIYSHTFTDAGGCDSTVTLQLSINPIHSTSLTEVICSGDSITVGPSVYKSSGIYTDVLTNKFGCDSTVLLDLTVNPSHDILVEKTICHGDSILIGLKAYKTTGIYENNFVNRFGCDSLVTLNLMVNPVHDTTLVEEICSGDSTRMGGANYKESGIFKTNLANQFGCDSLVTLYLTVNPVNETMLSEAICHGENYSVGNSDYSEVGYYTDVLSNQYGCDSIVYLDLNVNPVHDTNLTVTICNGESYQLGSDTYYNSGIFSNNFSNQFGCDSLVTVDLTVAALPVVSLGDDFIMFTSENIQLDAGTGYDYYAWSTGESTPSIQINRSLGLGEKEIDVTVTDENGCIGSDQIKITMYNDDDSPDDFDPDIKLFPNPTSDYVNILLEKISGKYEIRILAENGSMIFNKEYYASSDKILKTLNLSLRSGMYTIMVVHKDGVKVDKLVVQRQ